MTEEEGWNAFCAPEFGPYDPPHCWAKAHNVEELSKINTAADFAVEEKSCFSIESSKGGVATVPAMEKIFGLAHVEHDGVAIAKIHAVRLAGWTDE